jgi:hypothetical protein
MDFLKRHYEKLILGLVLLGLAAAAAYLPVALKRAQEILPPSGPGDLPTPKAYKPVSLASNEQAIAALKTPPNIALQQRGQDIFNPNIWKQKADGTLVRMTSSNPAEALKVLRIFPLHLNLTYERRTDAGGFFVKVHRELRKGDRQRPLYSTIGTTNEFFTILKANGPENDPESLLIQLVDTKQQVVLEKEKTWRRLEGHGADLRYDLENKTFRDERVGSTLNFGEDSYKVIAIGQNEVRVLANSNQKATTIRWTGVP